VGSGYGTALAREVVGREGLVVAIEIDAITLAFAWENLERAGYADVVLVHGDGGLGDREHAPYDRACVTAACPGVPPPLIEQLVPGGRMIVPVIEGARQRLTLLEKTVDGVDRKSLVEVLYVSLRGRYGVCSDPQSGYHESRTRPVLASMPTGAPIWLVLRGRTALCSREAVRLQIASGSRLVTRARAGTARRRLSGRGCQRRRSRWL
jgi:Protein-L-isoaspartate(D-aspartate) O-methyltransferase (PCMT)